MELVDALRTTGAVREFLPEPVSDEVVYRILDNARFAPSGGNRQGWHVVVVRDPSIRRRIRDAYLGGWYEYLAQRAAGLTPWSPRNDRAVEADAIGNAGAIAAAASPDGFAERVGAGLGVVRDVGRDAGQHVVTREHQPVPVLPEAQVPG